MNYHNFSSNKNFAEVAATNAVNATQAATIAIQTANTAASIASTSSNPVDAQNAVIAAQTASQAVNVATQASAISKSASETTNVPIIIHQPPPTDTGVSFTAIFLFVLCILLAGVGAFLYIKRDKIKFELSPSVLESSPRYTGNTSGNSAFFSGRN